MQLETVFPIIGTPTPVRHRRDHDGLAADQVRDVVSGRLVKLGSRSRQKLKVHWAKRRSSSANTSDAGMPGVSPES